MVADQLLRVPNAPVGNRQLDDMTVPLCNMVVEINSDKSIGPPASSNVKSKNHALDSGSMVFVNVRGTHSVVGQAAHHQPHVCLVMVQSRVCGHQGYTVNYGKCFI